MASKGQEVQGLEMGGGGGALELEWIERHGGPVIGPERKGREGQGRKTQRQILKSDSDRATETVVRGGLKTLRDRQKQTTKK